MCGETSERLAISKQIRPRVINTGAVDLRAASCDRRTVHDSCQFTEGMCTPSIAIPGKILGESEIERETATPASSGGEMTAKW